MRQSMEFEPVETMAKGLYEAISYRNSYLQRKKPFDQDLIKEFNKRLIKYTFDEAGSYRRKNVHMSDGAFTPSSWEKIPEKMEELVTVTTNHLKDLSLGPNDLSGLLAVVAWSHCRLAKIQPFIDGNKRTARLVADFILAKNDLPVIDWEPKETYSKALHQSLRIKQEGPFAHFLAEKLVGRYNELELRLRNTNIAVGLLSGKKSMIQDMVQSGIFRSDEYMPIASL